MGDVPPNPEESLFQDSLVMCRMPLEVMVDFRRCHMASTSELMTAARGVLEMKPLPEGVLEASVETLSQGGSTEWGNAQGTVAEKQQHSTMLARMALLCAMCRDDYDAARTRLREAHRSATGVSNTTHTVELRKTWKSNPRPKVAEMIRHAEQVYNTELTRARECDASTLLESLFALQDGELKIAAMKSDAYGGASVILREEERRDHSRVLVKEETQGATTTTYY
jgi:hypothetical protein